MKLVFSLIILVFMLSGATSDHENSEHFIIADLDRPDELHLNFAAGKWLNADCVERGPSCEPSKGTTVIMRARQGYEIYPRESTEPFHELNRMLEQGKLKAGNIAVIGERIVIKTAFLLVIYDFDGHETGRYQPDQGSWIGRVSVLPELSALGGMDIIAVSLIIDQHTSRSLLLDTNGVFLGELHGGPESDSNFYMHRLEPSGLVDEYLVLNELVYDEDDEPGTVLHQWRHVTIVKREGRFSVEPLDNQLLHQWRQGAGYASFDEYLLPVDDEHSDYIGLSSVWPPMPRTGGQDSFGVHWQVPIGFHTNRILGVHQMSEILVVVMELPMENQTTRTGIALIHRENHDLRRFMVVNDTMVLGLGNNALLVYDLNTGKVKGLELEWEQ